MTRPRLEAHTNNFRALLSNRREENAHDAEYYLMMMMMMTGTGSNFLRLPTLSSARLSRRLVDPVKAVSVSYFSFFIRQKARISNDLRF